MFAVVTGNLLGDSRVQKLDSGPVIFFDVADRLPEQFDRRPKEIPLPGGKTTERKNYVTRKVAYFGTEDQINALEPMLKKGAHVTVLGDSRPSGEIAYRAYQVEGQERSYAAEFPETIRAIRVEMGGRPTGQAQAPKPEQVAQVADDLAALPLG